MLAYRIYFRVKSLGKGFLMLPAILLKNITVSKGTSHCPQTSSFRYFNASS
jgi:hypothetical protein